MGRRKRRKKNKEEKEQLAAIRREGQIQTELVFCWWRGFSQGKQTLRV